jgi:hypothetical protein
LPKIAYKYSIALSTNTCLTIVAVPSTEALQRAAALSLQVEVPLASGTTDIFYDRLIDTKYITIVFFKKNVTKFRYYYNYYILILQSKVELYISNN